ncbi:GNAT superfamily N-acetyltransferase [Saccharothrix tamanrassetensis]|uniref:GNAT superfamily N-acetyltransferase n=1 Tax=Saccharothrix tamanrassetensis TaxID=1051531 RepID=A0A841CJ82_9PSEU|nr:GNAT family N-acetyltransferase [Saccharothrix tamanrassetensis]MBB5957359.1 GNAT superfamily N-acetyltransferase [Saccharothrix tamanrassetensis]
MADVARHHDVAGFWAVAGDFFTADPVFHTVPVAAVHRRLNNPQPTDEALVLLTVVENGEVVAAAVRTPPWALAVSGVPVEWVDAVVEGLSDVDLPGVNGPRESAEAFALAWTARHGGSAREATSLRLYRLGELVPPTDVPGRARVATEDDAELLVRWYMEFVDESTPYDSDEELANTFVRGSLAAGSGHLLWLEGDRPVAWAGAGRPAAGMSRIGPVYTPEEHRRHGYGAAVTSACARWASDAGAEHVVLFTDLANPTSNSIYQRIGFRPVCDAAEFVFTPPAPAPR